jgi:hypothetical protein
MLNSPKLAILQSLDEMDQNQMDEVLHYIKGVLNPPARVLDHQTLKRKALKEIRQALRREKKREVGMTA